MERFEKRASEWEQKIRVAAKSLFEKQKSDILARLQGQKSIPDPFDLDEWIGEFKTVLTPILREAIRETGQSQLDELGTDITFNAKNAHVTKFLKLREQKFAIKLNEDTWEQLKDSFAEAIDAGENIAQMMERVETIMGEKIKSSPETIARTEIISSLNKGTHESWKQSEVVSKKQWLAARDNRTRDAHREAHEYYARKPCPIDEPFIVDGEELMYPGDPNGSAENVIQCRCSMKAIVD